ncbi:MAG: hypothetical protein CL840_18575 [Crocinitomicaceae bacterium]|nr:hypothetical protein [Crocinitomicaceae bacterium]
MVKFTDLDLSEELIKVLPELGFENPTEIQAQSIPILNQQDSDFIGLAQTGTGKTCAFGFPLLDYVDPERQVTQSLVVAPTRELSMQIAEQLKAYAKYKRGLKITVVYGGANIVPQMKELRSNPQVIVATPGRLIDLVNRKAINLGKVGVVVLDEADEMLNMGFKEDIDIILSHTPDSKMTWLFSATMPNEIRRISNEYMVDPIEIRVTSGEETNKNIEHQFAQLKTSDKMEGLKRFLDRDPDMRGVIFCRTKIDTQNVAEKLAKDDYKVEPLHGDMSQAQRERVMRRFKSHELQVVVATDVAARGIDVNNLTHVIHYSLPDSREYYTHRSGRTARAGKKGISLALVNSREVQKLKEYESRLKIKFEKVKVPSVSDVQINRMQLHFESIRDTKKSVHLTEEILDAAYETWHGMEIDELIDKLVSHELNKLNYKKDHKDLNDTSRSRDRGDRGDRRGDRRRESRRDRERASRKPGKKDPNVVSFFINLGEKDGMDQSKLRNFISRESGIKKSDILDVRMRNLNAYFDINKKHSSTVSSSFRGKEMNGRELRVNRDNS